MKKRPGLAHLKKESPNIWATIQRNIFAKNFQKSPNLVTLVTNALILPLPDDSNPF